MNHPKVLVVNGVPFSSSSATGITMSNLFKGWPKDKIAQVYTANVQPDDSLCQNNWKLSNKDLFIAGQDRNHFKKRPFSNNVLDKFDHANNTIKVESSKSLLLRSIITPWLDLLNYKISPQFLIWLQEFKPDIVYSTLGNIRFVRLSSTLSQLFSVPVVPHFMDDWLSTYSVKGRSFLTILQRTIIKAETRRLMHRVPLGFAICEAMANEYSQLYNRKFYSFMNPVEIYAQRNIARFTDKNKSVRFVYVGGLHLSRYENLSQISKIIRGLKNDGQDIELRIYAPKKDLDQYGSFLKKAGATICGSLSPDEVHNVLCECDVAIHVESFSKKHSLYTRLSVSTKIPQYFAAGLPVLAFGPSDVASCRYVADSDCGILVGNHHLGNLARAISKLTLHPEIRHQFGRKCLEIAKERHAMKSEQERFQFALSQAVSFRGGSL